MRENIVISRSATITASLGQKKAEPTGQIASRLAVGCLLLIASSSLMLAQAGHLDKAFGDAGIFTVNPGLNSGATSVALQRTAKIVIGGQVNGVGAILSVTSNGQLDTSFGSGGLVTNRFGIDAGVIVLAIAVQSDDKILALATGFPGSLSIGRFNPDGSIDTTFGSQGFTGRFASGQPSFAAALALQSDGDILAGSGFLMSRFKSTGALDTTFGNAGTAPLKLASPNVNAIAVQPNGRILVASSDIGGEGAVTRYNSNGSPDTNFGILGQSASISPTSAMDLQPDGRIVVVGSLPTTLSPARSGFGLIRYNNNGSIDTTFVSHGGTATSFPGNATAAALASAIQANGDLIAAGQAFSQLNQSKFALARYTSGGMLDSTFGTGGRVLTSFGSNNPAAIAAIVLQPDGKIVVAGAIGSSFGVARYLAE